MGKAKAKAKSGAISYVPSPCRARDETGREVELLSSPQPKSDPQEEEEVVIQPHPSSDCSLNDAFDLARKAQAAWEDAAKACSMDLGRKLTEQTHALEAAYASKLACENELRERLSEIEDLKARCSDRDELEHHLAAKDAELDAARTALEEAQRALEEKKSALQELEGEVSKQLEEQAALQREFEAVRDERSALSTSLAERTQETEEQAAELESLKEDNEALAFRLEELLESSRVSEAREEDLKRDVLQQQEMKEALRAEFDAVKEECATYKSLLEEETCKTDGQAAELVTFQENQKALDERVTKLLESLSASEAREEEQRKTLELSQASWEQEMAGLLAKSEEQAAEERSKAEAKLQETLSAERGRWEAKLEAALAKQKSKLEAQLQSSLDEERTAWEAKCSKSESAASKAQAELQRKFKQEQQWKKEAQQHLKKEQEAKAELQQQLKQEQQTKKEAQQQLATLKQQQKQEQQAKKEVQQQLAALRSEATELRSKLEDEQAGVADLEEIVKEERADRISLEAKLQKQDDELTKLRDVLATQEASIRSFDEKMATAQRDFEQKLEEKASALEAAKTALASAQTSVQPLEQEVEEGREKIAALSELLEKANAERSEQQHELEVKEIALKDRLEDLEAVVERTQVLQSRTSQLEAELEEAEALRRCLDLNLVASREELQDERQRVEEFSNRIAELSKELEEQMLGEGSSEELRVQNRELVVSVNQFKRDCELLGAEVASLKGTLAIFESDLERVQGHNAELSGHANHKQKIRHTMQLKDEIGNLRKKLGVAHEKITKLEVESFGVNFFEALASLGVLRGFEAGHSQGHFSVQQAQGHQSLCSLSNNNNYNNSGNNNNFNNSVALGLGGFTRGPAGSVKSAAPSHRRLSCGGTFREDLAFQNRYYGLERRCTLQQRALEKVSVDFAHFLALIERAVYLSDGSETSEAKVSQHSLPQLLHELRDVVDRLQNRRPEPLASHRSP